MAQLTDNPELLKFRDYGHSYFVQTLPNSYERMFMIMRSTNFDIDNFQKLYNQPDKAQRWRYFKNILRLVDRPSAWLFWRFLPYFQTGKIRALPLYFLFTFGLGWLISGRQQAQAAYRTAVAEKRKGSTLHAFPREVFSYQNENSWLFHECEVNMEKGLATLKAVPPLYRFVRINNNLRDQNFRKYFEHRERRGVDLFTGKPKNA